MNVHEAIELNPNLEHLPPKYTVTVAVAIKKGEAVVNFMDKLMPAVSDRYVSIGTAKRDLDVGEVIQVTE